MSSPVIAIRSDRLVSLLSILLILTATFGWLPLAAWLYYTLHLRLLMLAIVPACFVAAMVLSGTGLIIGVKAENRHTA
jgi:hypothetical protein